jgi:AraC-like DNA-binding protein
MKTMETMQMVQLVERLERLGVGTAELCAQVGLERSQLADVDGRLPFELALETLRAALVQPPRGLLMHQFRAQPSLKAALEQLARNAPLSFSPLSGELEVGTRSARLRFRLDDVPSDALAALHEYLAGFVTRFLGETAPAVSPSEVRFDHAPRAPLDEYERLLGAPVRFQAPECAVVLPPDRIAEPIVTANPVVARVLSEQIDSRLSMLGSGNVRGGVEHAIEELLRENRAVGREAVARRLGLSVRTLQRRLAAEGVSFHDLRETTLARIGRALLALPNLPLEEVARRSGFSDEDAFAKAWKRWTGETPREHRRRLAAKRP